MEQGKLKRELSIGLCGATQLTRSVFHLEFSVKCRMEESRSAFIILTGRPTGKIPLGRPRRRWEDNIRMDLEEVGINAGNWVDSTQDRNYWRALAALNLRVP